MESKDAVSETVEEVFADASRLLGLPVSNFIKHIWPTPLVQYKAVRTAQGIKHKWVGDTPRRYSLDVTLLNGQVRTLNFSMSVLLSRTRFELVWADKTSRYIDAISHKEWRLMVFKMLPLAVERYVEQPPK